MKLILRAKKYSVLHSVLHAALTTALLTSLTAAWADVPRTQQELDLQISLENQFTAKLKPMLQDRPFIVTVTLKPHSPVKLDLLGGTVSVSDRESEVLEQIQTVNIYTEDNLNTQSVSQVMGVPLTQIRVARLEMSKKSNTDVDASLFSRFQDFCKAHYQGLMSLAFILLGLVSLVVVFALFNLGTIVTRFMNSLTDALKNSGGGINASALEQTTERAVAKNKPDAPHTLQNFSPIQLKAMFAECYWTAHDAEACALVRQYPLIEIYQDLKFGPDYLNYLKRMQPGSLDFTQDPYFLSPNIAFFELSVEDTPAQAIPFASQLRFEKAATGALEIIKVQQQGNVSPMIRTTPSTHRQLKLPIRVRFKTVDEEEKVFASKEIPSDLKLQLPSLYLLTFLKPESFVGVINQLTVKELAQAWIGPPTLLNELESKLPEKKRALLREVAPKIAPDRDSVAYQRIIELCQNELSASPPPQKSAA